MVRLFVALPLPAAIRARLELLMGGVPGARWVPPENLHITLRFIGEVDGGTAEDVAASLNAIAAPRFDLSLAGVDVFGRGDATRKIWTGVERAPALGHLRDKVESAVVRCGLPAESRKFTPHVSLARLRDAVGSRLGAFVQSNQLFRAGPFEIDRFVLFSSWLGHGHAVYRPEAEYMLRQAAA